MHLGIVEERARAREADRPRRLAGEAQLAPGLTTHADERLDLGELGAADWREDRRCVLAEAGRVGGLLHFRSTLLWLVGELILPFCPR